MIKAPTCEKVLTYTTGNDKPQNDTNQNNRFTPKDCNSEN